MLRTISIAAVIALIPSAAFADDASTHLELACMGGGAANKIAGATAYGWDNHGNSAGANIVGTRSVGFEDQVNVSIDGGEGRIRMPRSMLPPIHGGDDGWFKLKSIEMGEREITASIAVNALNNPKLHRHDQHLGQGR